MSRFAGEFLREPSKPRLLPCAFYKETFTRQGYPCIGSFCPLGLVVRNVADLVDPPTPKRKQPQTLTAEQVKRFLRVVQDHRFYPIYLLASAIGMWEAEILSLHWPDINLEGKSLYVRYTLQVIKKKGMQLADPKTEKSKRVIPLPDYVIEVLRNLPRGSDRVFTTSTGNFISPRNLIRHFKASLKKAELPDMTFHQL